MLRDPKQCLGLPLRNHFRHFFPHKIDPLSCCPTLRMHSHQWFPYWALLNIPIHALREGFASRRLGSLVRVAHQGDERAIKLTLSQGLAVKNHPRGPLVGRLQSLSGQCNRVHQIISFFALHACGNAGIIIGPAKFFGASGSGSARSLAAALNTVDEREPIRGCVVILDRASLDHVSKTFSSSVLASEDPVPTWPLGLVSISIRIQSKIHDSSNILDRSRHLRGGVVFAPGSHGLTVEVNLDVLCSDDRQQHNKQRVHSLK